ncbi:MAG TPA: hypothetical protein VF443_07320 [Nitrospira sp.]
MFSPEYKSLQERFHQERPDYGISGQRYAQNVSQICQGMQTRDVLDYGCGKCSLSNNLPFPIQNYDPFIPAYSSRPRPADLVVCTDVMEHVEPEHTNAVLADIASLAQKAAFFQIATRPASKVLPDGRNAHLVIQPVSWWMRLLMVHFEPVTLQTIPGGFIFFGYPHREEVK